MSIGTVPVLELSHAAAADQSTKVGYFFKIDSNDRAAICDTLGERATAGVLMDKPTAIDIKGLYALEGLHQVWAGGTVSKGHPISTTAAGKAQRAAIGHTILGYAMEDMADGALYSAHLTPGAGKLQQGAPTFTIGAEAANVITVNVQVNDELGTAATVPCSGLFYLASDSAGLDIIANDAALSVAAGTDGSLTDLETDGPYHYTTEADGDLDVAITKTDAGTVYLVMVNPDGTITVSDAITFV